METKKINLQEILDDIAVEKGWSIADRMIKDVIVPAMFEACKQVLELGFENADAELIDSTDDSRGLIVIVKESITDTIKQVVI